MEEKMDKALKAHFTEFKDEIKNMFKQEMKTNNEILMKEFNQLKSAMDFLSQKYEEIVKENGLLKEEIKTIKLTNVENSNQIKSIQIDSQKLILKINDLENVSRMANVEIHGVPMHQNENLDRMVMSLLKIVDPTIVQNDIKESFRIKRFMTEEKNPNKGTPILVKFMSTNKRLDILKNKRKLAGFNFKDIGVDTQRVFINENLTSYAKNLFYQANLLKKNHGWKYIWTRNGNIKLRHHDDSPVISIRDTADLRKIVSQTNRLST